MAQERASPISNQVLCLRPPLLAVHELLVLNCHNAFPRGRLLAIRPISRDQPKLVSQAPRLYCPSGENEKIQSRQGGGLGTTRLRTPE